MLEDATLYKIQVDFAKAMATYVGHLGLRGRRQRLVSFLTWSEILLQGVAATAVLNVLIADTNKAKIVAACLSCISLILSIYNFKVRPNDQLKEAFRLEEEQWNLKETYSSLILNYVSGRISADAAEQKYEEIMALRKTVASGQMLTEKQFDNALRSLLEKRPIWMSRFLWEMMCAPFSEKQG